MEYKHVKIERHPLRDAWCVHNVTFPMIPPYVGTKKECEKAAKAAEQSAEKLLRCKECPSREQLLCGVTKEYAHKQFQHCPKE